MDNTHELERDFGNGITKVPNEARVELDEI